MERHEKLTSPSVTEAMLHAYLDGELDTRAREQVEAALDENPDLAARFRDYAAQNRDLHELFDPHLDEGLPLETHRLIWQLEQANQSGNSDRGPMRIAAAAAVIAIFASVSLLTYQQVLIRQEQNKLFAMFQESVAIENPKSEESKVKPAVASQPPAIIQRPPAEGGTKSEAPAAKRAPDLSKFGFRLVGTRVQMVSSKPAMQLLYQNEEGSQISLYFSPTKSENQSLTLMQQGPLSLLFWSNNGRLYTMLGEIDRDTLLEVGRVVNSNWTLVPNSPLPGGDRAAPVKPSVQERKPSKPHTRNGAPAVRSQKLNIKPAQDGSVENGDPSKPSVGSPQARNGSA